MHPQEITVPTSYNMWISHIIGIDSFNKSILAEKCIFYDSRKLPKNTINTML